MYDAQYSNHLKVTYLGNYLEMTKEDMDNIMLRKKNHHQENTYFDPFSCSHVSSVGHLPRNRTMGKGI